MTQGQFSQGSFPATPGYQYSFPASSSLSAAFSYPTARLAVVQPNRPRAQRPRRRFCPSLPRRWIVAALWCIFIFPVMLSGSIWLLQSVYLSENLEIGRHFSRVYTANSFFYRKIVVTSKTYAEGPVIYGFAETPALNQEIEWTEVLDAVVSSNNHQEWAFWLNKGSQIALQYNISDPSMEVLLVVIQGEENMQKWVQDLSILDSVSSWQLAQDVGTFQHEVKNNDKYYLAVANVQSSSVKVALQTVLQGRIYNAEDYISRCSLTSAACSVNLRFLGSDALLLETPKIDQTIQDRKKFERFMQQSDDSWILTIAFEQRWITYVIFWAVIAVIILILLVFCKPASQDSQASEDSHESLAEATPLMTSNDVEDKIIECDLPECSALIFPADIDKEGTELSEDYLCIICFDARRNCFFDPCGHCVTCYACSIKILKQKKALCPLCRQPIRFVRRHFLH